MKKTILFLLLIAPFVCIAQNIMTPELLWKLGRMNAIGVSKDKKYVVYTVAVPDVSQNKNSTKTYRMPVTGGAAEEISNADTIVYNTHISADGKWKISDSDVKVMNVYGS